MFEFLKTSKIFSLLFFNFCSIFSKFDIIERMLDDRSLSKDLLMPNFNLKYTNFYYLIPY